LEGLFLAAGVKPENLAALYALLDKKHKITPEEFSTELSAVSTNEGQRERIRKVLEATSLSQVAEIQGDLPAIKELEHLFSFLDAYGLAEFAAFDIGIVRGLAYYTGTVFEVFDKMRSMRAIAGGGRYDRLVAMYGGPDTPAVGFAAGDVVLGELYKTKFGPVPQAPRSAAFIVSFDQTRPKIAVDMAQALRAAGVSCEFSLKPAGVGKQMEQANAARSRIVVFVGGSESAEGKVKIKDMLKGEERTVDARTVTEEVKKTLSGITPS
jgi:histidyl-tRNA synthetase